MRPSMLGNKPNGHGPASVKEIKKLTFDEWYKQRLIDFDGRHPSAKEVWKAAQENKE